MANDIMIVNDFLSASECEQMFVLFNITPFRKNETGNWAYRVKWPVYPENLLARIKDERIKLCQEFFGEPLEIDNLNMTLWNTGNGMAPHRDDGWQQEYPHRKYASIIYLNEDYEGGELFIPQINFTNKPKRGQLVSFPGIKYAHGVTEVTFGTRLTSICWMKPSVS